MTEPCVLRTGRVVRRRPGFAGMTGAVLLLCLSLTPSLLPRHWVLQGVVSGISMAFGYGLGATIGAAVRALWPQIPAASKRRWLGLAGAGGVLTVVFLWLGARWQQEVRELVGVEPATAWNPLLILVVAAAVLGLLLAVARSVRLLTRRLATTFGRYTPRPVASVTAVGLVAAMTYALGPVVAFPGFVDVANRAAAGANASMAAGLTPPSSWFVSGGPGSLVPWETLGRYGREFVSGTVTQPVLADATGRPTRPPVRVYVGRDSAETLADRVDLAVRELERTGAFDRSVLAVVTTTGTGWVNPVVPTALEYLHGGDTAVVAMQYSYLPSWISFLADRAAVAEAASALLEAIGERLAELPEPQRPTLVGYGESLGAHGTEAAFGELDDLLAATDAVLLAGPPHTNPIWQQVVESRDPDSPIWRPTVDGAVRFAQYTTDLSDIDGAPGLVYLQNATDPIVWWSPELLYRKPSWLNGDRAPDVSGAMTWYPIVTFWQVTVDLVLSTKAPSGHGHSYGGSIVDAWAALVPPPDWTDADTAHLRTLLPQR